MALTVEGIFEDIVARDIKRMIDQQNIPARVETNFKGEQKVIEGVVKRDIEVYCNKKLIY